MAAVCNRLGLPCNIQPHGGTLLTLADVGKTEVWISSSDFLRYGSHRLETVPVAEQVRTHTTPCKMMLASMNIAYSGTASLCCEFCHGIAGQERYALGSAWDATVYDLLEKKKTFMIRYLSGNLPRCCLNCKGN